MKGLKDNWMGYLFVFILSGISSLLLWSMNTRKDDKSILDRELKELKTATETLQNKIEVNGEDHTLIRTEFNTSVKEINENMREIRNYIYTAKH